MSPLFDRILKFRTEIPDSVRIIAVTKTVSPEAMRIAYTAGMRDFGESRIQEAETKRAELADLTDVTWHLIGHLQSNKVQKAIDLFDWIQSIDTLKLAERCDRIAGERQRQPQILLQVKLLSDPNKSGWSEAELLTDLPKLSELQHLQIRGLMAIAPLTATDDEILDLYKRTHNLAAHIQTLNLPRIQMDQLSMGMSDDYRLGIQAGATLIRPGRVLFGER
jgi:PLP dependent protein